MIAILTGDIIKSRSAKKSEEWLLPLKKNLRKWGKSGIDWDIYRGDGIQIRLAEPQMALKLALLIKTKIKQHGILDIRMAIGIGKEQYRGAKISQSNGEAYINSGLKLDELKKEKITLALASPWADVDSIINLLLQFAAPTMDKWSVVSAEYIALLLEHPEYTQNNISKKLKISQSSVSERSKRAHSNEIQALLKYYEETITAKLNPKKTK